MTTEITPQAALALGFFQMFEVVRPWPLRQYITQSFMYKLLAIRNDNDVVWIDISRRCCHNVLTFVCINKKEEKVKCEKK